MLELTDPVTVLPLVGPSLAKKLAKLGLTTLKDLLYHFPYRYDDYTNFVTIDSLPIGENVTLTAKVESVKNTYTRHHLTIQRAVLSDQTGSIEAVWFNQTFIAKNFIVGATYNFAGRVKDKPRRHLISPVYEPSAITDHLHTKRLVPVYPETAGISSRWLRGKISYLLKATTALPDYLPLSLIKAYGLIGEDLAIRHLHFPDNVDQVTQATNRLAIDELVYIQINSIRAKQHRQQQPTNSISHTPSQIDTFVTTLPYQLTAGQIKSIAQITADLAKATPMNRLLEGDVGSGKTVIAILAAYLTAQAGFHTLVMAPTQILAEQHYQTFSQLLSPFHIGCALVTAGTRRLASTSAITIGTHALLNHKGQNNQVGLIIIDEQHRFGVNQRSILSQHHNTPHLLTMTATPIPRTVALAAYGHLDLSTLDELPQNRLPVKTWVVPENKRLSGYHWIEKQIHALHSQVFIICPFIEESDTNTTVKAALTEFTNITSCFPNHKVALLHGRMQQAEKNQILTAFKNKAFDILVATPIVEVGIDIPNASVIVIEGAERYGLAQLHQLRGRVGRGVHQSYCLLFTSIDSPAIAAKLQRFCILHNGSELAELDLHYRGAGDIFGLRQHGFIKMNIASLVNHQQIETAQNIADSLVNDHKYNHVLANQYLQERLENYKIATVSLN